MNVNEMEFTVSVGKVRMLRLINRIDMISSERYGVVAPRIGNWSACPRIWLHNQCSLSINNISTNTISKKKIHFVGMTILNLFIILFRFVLLINKCILNFLTLSFK